MAYPKLNEPYLLYTDASNFAVGEVLVQTDENGIERPMFMKVLFVPSAPPVIRQSILASTCRHVVVLRQFAPATRKLVTMATERRWCNVLLKGHVCGRK